MANKLFNKTQKSSPKLTTNNAGGQAYQLKDKEALAQIALTGTFNGTYYVSDSQNLALVKKHVSLVDSDFIAKLAIYSRTEGYLKDMPAFLCATLLARGDYELFHKVFDKVIDNTKMLRNFVQIGRSGEAGRKINMSAGAARKAINRWFSNKTPEYIFKTSIGNNPTIQDILKLSRPKPSTKAHAALFAYLLGKPQNSRKTFEVKNKEGKAVYSHQYSQLPQIVKDYEAFKNAKEGEIPDVDFRMLDSILSGDQLKSLWTKQAEIGGWHLVRMNLNNFAKYGVFKNSKLTKIIGDKLTNKQDIAKSKVYPYQLMTAYLNVDNDVPSSIRNSLQEAMEVACENVPEFNTQTHVCVDTSGSMSSPITGYRAGASSKTTCVQVAALIASVILRRNKNSTIVPFDTRVHNHKLNPFDSIMTNASSLSKYGGGGTNCSSALKYLNDTKATGNLVIFVSDNESWMDRGYGKTAMKQEWDTYKRRNPKAKLVCIDLVPNTTTQVPTNKDVLNVGGFSDACFDVIKSFIQNEQNFVGIIDQLTV